MTPTLTSTGWPAFVGVAAGDLLPLVLPGHDSAVLDSDDDGDDEVVDHGGHVGDADRRAPRRRRRRSTLAGYDSAAGNRFDEGPILNLADYQSIGDIEGLGRPAVVKGGLTANGAANLLAVNQNLPFNHVEQAFDVTLPPDENTGLVPSLAGYPRATDDFQLVSQASIARVGETTVPGGHQALVGTGMYQLHAYGPGGFEPAGWPKFTGGWTQATPSVGDADGDGDLDVTTLTREGWSFLWDTGVDACDGSNEEWWTYHHDEHSTANYGHDGRPPGTPTDLTATRVDGGVQRHLHRTRRRLALRRAGPLPRDHLPEPDPAPDQRHDGRRCGHHRLRRGFRGSASDDGGGLRRQVRGGPLPRRGRQLGPPGERADPARRN